MQCFTVDYVRYHQVLQISFDDGKLFALNATEPEVEQLLEDLARSNQSFEIREC